MKRSLISALGLALAVQATVSNAEIKPVTGTASMYFPPNIPVISALPVTGEYNTDTQNITIDPWMFFGANVYSSIDLLSPGSYSYSGVAPFSVGSGQLGGYITTNWSVNTIPHAIVWDVSYHPSGQHLEPTDSDGDGVVGHTMISGPFPGISFVYELDIGSPSPMVDVDLNIAGGTVQECSQVGGSQVGLSAQVQLSNGAELASIEWTVDGQPAGTGASISPFMSLGTHTVSVTASGISGIYDTESATVSIRDTTDPDLSIEFIDTRSGMSVTSVEGAGVSFIEIHLGSTDVCDGDVDTSGVAKPVYAILGSEVIKIQGNNQTVDMPTTAVEVNATAIDDSGNKQIDQAVLRIAE